MEQKSAKANSLLLYLLATTWTLSSAQHCLYPFHKHVRLPGVDKKTFRECVPPGKFELKDCPGESEYDIHLQACKFADGETEPEKVKTTETNVIGNGVQDRIGKSMPIPPSIGGNFAQQTSPQMQNGGVSVIQFAPSLPHQQQSQSGSHQGQWQPMMEQPIEMLQNCVLDGWCPHDPKKLQYCDLNGQQFLQCSPSGWVMKSCPFGTHFVGPIGRCVDPRESGGGGSVLAPPAPPPTPTPILSSNIPFAPPGSQLVASPPSAPSPPAPATAGSWIGNNVPLATNPISVPSTQSILNASPQQFHSQNQPRLIPTSPQFSQSSQFSTGQSSSANTNPITAADLSLQKAHELPQGQLVIIGTNSQQPIANGQFPTPHQVNLPPTSFSNFGNSQEPQVGWPQPPPSSGPGQQIPSFPTVLHPRTKVFPPVPISPAAPPTPNWPSPSSSSSSSENDLSSNIDVSITNNRWPIPPPEPAPSTPQANSNNNQLLNRFQNQNWVLGGNVNNFSPSTSDVRELPMGTWVPQQQLQPPPSSWPGSGNFPTTDTVISGRYASGVDVDYQLPMPHQNSFAANQQSDADSDKKKL